MSSNNSVNGNRHPYLRVEKWLDGSVPHFWESAYYSEKTKEKYRNWLLDWDKSSRKPKG